MRGAMERDEVIEISLKAFDEYFKKHPRRKSVHPEDVANLIGYCDDHQSEIIAAMGGRCLNDECPEPATCWGSFVNAVTKALDEGLKVIHGKPDH